MRLRTLGLTEVYLKERIVERDDEGNDIISFSSDYVKLDMNVQSAGGAKDSATFGEKLNYTEKAKYQGDKVKRNKHEGWGICLYVDKDSEPDYIIKSIHPKTFHMNITLEMRDIRADKD